MQQGQDLGQHDIAASIQLTIAEPIKFVDFNTQLNLFQFFVYGCNLIIYESKLNHMQMQLLELIQRL